MKPSVWERLQEIYHAAQALPLSEREAFVTQACAGDADLLAQVNSLLKTDQEFLKDPVFACPTLSDPLVGTTIDNRYDVQRELVGGGMAKVFVARDRQLPGRLVVIKVLPQTAVQGSDAVRRAKRELQALTVLDHANVVSVIGAGEVAVGKPYIAMQYIDGVTLRSHIESNGLDVKRAASILKQIGAALSHIHKKGVLHRDLKPENIMIQVSDGTEVVKILDFGIAKLKDTIAATSTVNTVAIGTIAYMSPEQLWEGKPITAASDIYSMAVIACEMITGKRPPSASQKRLIKIVDLPPGLSENARRVLVRALSFNPNDRYQDAKQFGDDLAKALLDSEVKGPTNPPRRWTLAKSLALFGAVIIFTSLSFVIYKYVTTPPPKLPPSKAFKYWLMVQKMRDGKEFEAPYKSNGNEMFANGDKFQLNVSTTESGYLYVFNEGPLEPGTASFKIIYPNSATNNGSASVGANQTVQSDWITFRGPEGAENFWIVWSVSPVNELEIAGNVASNNSRQGLLGNQLVKVKEFLKTMEPKVDSKPPATRTAS